MISFPILVAKGGASDHAIWKPRFIRLFCFLRFFFVIAKVRNRRNMKKQTVGMGTIHMAFPRQYSRRTYQILGHGLIRHSSMHCLHFAAYLIALLGMALTCKLCMFK